MYNVSNPAKFSFAFQQLRPEYFQFYLIPEDLISIYKSPMDKGNRQHEK